MDRVKSSHLPTIKETLVPCWSPPWEVRRATMAFRLKAYFTILLLIHLFETSSCMMPLIRSREGGAPHSYTMTKVLDHGACETWSTTMRLEHCRRISTFLSYMCFPFACFLIQILLLLLLSQHVLTRRALQVFILDYENGGPNPKHDPRKGKPGSKGP